MRDEIRLYVTQSSAGKMRRKKNRFAILRIVKIGVRFTSECFTCQRHFFVAVYTFYICKYIKNMINNYHSNRHDTNPITTSQLLSRECDKFENLYPELWRHYLFHIRMIIQYRQTSHVNKSVPRFSIMDRSVVN